MLTSWILIGGLLQLNPRFPDFKHKETGESLWLADGRNPTWVQAELAAIPPGTLQSTAFAWGQRLKRYVKAGEYMKTMEAFHQMQQERICPDTWTFLSVLNACAGLGALEEGKRVHKQIIQVGCESNVYVATCLVDMYAKCGSVADAWSVFMKMPEHDVVSWNAMILGFVKSGQGLKAMELFWEMQDEEVETNAATFVGMLNACASVAALDEGRRVHEQIIQRGRESDVYVGSALVDMYAKCGSIEDAWSVFNTMQDHNVVTWSAMIWGYVRSGQGLKAMGLFNKMQQEQVEPDTITFVGMLNACASVAALEEGRHVHEQIVRRGCESDVYVGNCLVDMYIKCGSMEDAWGVFNKMQEYDVVTWSAMIAGYVKSGQGLKAIEVFRKMQQEGVEPDTITFVGVLNACASVAAHDEGRRVHGEIIQRGCQSDIYIGSSLVNMYAKCGCIHDAWSVFSEMQERDVVAWNAMIGAYAMHGCAKEVIGLFKQMCKEGRDADEITFTGLLSACNHGGLVKEGLRYFKSISPCLSILPTEEHYACIVDLLGRAGWLLEAEQLTKRMPFTTGLRVWMSLLGACRIHGNTKIAERAAKQCLELDPGNASAHMLLLNIYAAARKWDRSAVIGEGRLERIIQEEPGRTWIEVNNVVHCFTLDKKRHPEMLESRAKLERLSVQMNEAGYVSGTRSAINADQTRSNLCGHSEELAVAYGLISTPAGTPLRIIKSLQLCPDCHAAIKFIAKMVRRVITVRDVDCFHRFEGGSCSCKDCS